MKAHPWPGNVHELKNVVERCIVFGKNEIIQVEDLLFAGLGRPAEKAPDAFKTLEELERDHIARVLKHCQGRKGKAADLLGIDRKTLARKLKTFDL